MFVEIDWRGVDELVEDDDFEHCYPGTRVIRLPSFGHVYVRSPPEHDYYCAESGYHECDCDFDERNKAYDIECRRPGAEDLPEARLLIKP